MDSKEGIAQVAPVNARAVGLLDPSLLRSGTDDAVTADLPRERVSSPVRSPTSLGENPRWESCCLYTRVLRDSDVVLEQDRKVPDYCWNAGICKDICKTWSRVLPGTFSVDLLSDTEFLVYILPKTVEECPIWIRHCSRTSLREVICGLVFWLMYLSHRELLSRQGGIRPKCVNITIGLRWSD